MSLIPVFPEYPQVDPTNLQHPEVLRWIPYLGALAALHLILALQMWWWQRRQFSSQALKRFGPGISLWRNLLKTALWAAAAWQLLVALAVPLGPPLKIEGKQYGADVIFCVDVSSSMQAQDVRPNRLEAVKAALGGMLDRFEGDRVGLLAFAGDPVLACPLTTDYDTAALFLDKLDGDSVPRDGTDLAAAIAAGLDDFPSDPDRGRILVLATDGEDNAGADVLEQVRRAKQAGVAILCVGVGSADGAYIPGQRDFFGRVYAKTWHGQPVRTRLDRAGLERIARESGGEYLPGDSPASLEKVAARVRQLKQGMGKAPDRYVREPLYQAPLLWAILLLLADALVSARGRGFWRVGEALWRRLSKRWRPTSKSAPIALVLLALAAGLSAADGDWSQYNAGNEAYRKGDFGAAAEAYRKAGGDQILEEAADYNLGNALFRSKDYQGAVNAYDAALKIDANDQDAQYNRDLAQRMLEQQRKNPQQNQQNQKNQQNQQNQQNQNGQGQSQGQGQGRSSPRPGQGSPQAGRGQGQLSRDQVETMMNQLRRDQKKYEGAFSPLKRYPKDQQKNEDPAERMFEQMTGMRPPNQPTPTPTDPNYKDW
jgi:Ca-activated chloride channel family protein